MKRRILGILGFLLLLAAVSVFDLDTADNVRRKAARPRIRATGPGRTPFPNRTRHAPSLPAARR